MRYWIWWNDLVQGPFEPDELTSLKAFSGDLLVCMEDREDWIPAGRIADLSGAVEKQNARASGPSLPPPPPPKRTTPVTPLQGEFFGEPPGQQSLIDTEEGPTGPFAYRPVSGEISGFSAPYLEGRVTMPFHFLRQPETSSAAVLDIPRPTPERMRIVPPRIVRESPMPKPEEAQPIPLNVVEPAQEREIFPSRAPFFDEPAKERKPQWLPWILGVALVLAALGSVSFWLIDRASTHSAITEAIRTQTSAQGHAQVAAPAVVAKLPTAPSPVHAVAAAPRANVPRATTKRAHPHAKGASKKSVTPKREPILPAAPAVQVPLPGVSEAPAMPEHPAAPVAKEEPPLPSPAEVAQPERYMPAKESAPNPWRGKENEAIALVQNKHLPKSKVTVGEQAKTMLQEMHEKELLHAADTGERLYLPDKITWSALNEEGPRYRVYLNFLAMQASGERVQTRSYQFIVDLKTKAISTEDPGAQQDLLTQPAALTFKHNPMATDIDSILGGVDVYNKHKMNLIIVKKNNRNRDERKKIEAALATAQAKVQRAVIYFRRTYNEKTLQNIAKAYEFADLLKG